MSKKEPPEQADQTQLGQNAKKWGEKTWGAGWVGIPDALLHGQARLNISAAELSVLLQLLRRWWRVDEEAFPSRQTIADATGQSVRTVQRALDGLVRGGFIEKRHRRKNGGDTSNAYSFDGLIEALKPIAEELREEREKRQAAKQGITQRKSRRKKS